MHIDLREAWKQINELMGQKVITIDTITHPNWEDQEVLEKCGSESYILTPEEVVQYGPSLRTSPGCFANPDPRREEAIEILLHTIRHEDKYNNQPRYWIARPAKTDRGIKVWIDHACLQSTDDLTPMHKLGEKDGVSVIFYNYYRHSGIMSYGCKNQGAVLNRMKKVGIKIPA